MSWPAAAPARPASRTTGSPAGRARPAAALPAIGVLLGITLLFTLVAIRVFRWDDI